MINPFSVISLTLLNFASMVSITQMNIVSMIPVPGELSVPWKVLFGREFLSRPILFADLSRFLLRRLRNVKTNSVAFTYPFFYETTLNLKKTLPATN